MHKLKELFSGLHRHHPKKQKEVNKKEEEVEKKEDVEDEGNYEEIETGKLNEEANEGPQKPKRKVLLIVLDGFGEAENPDPRPKGNAIVLAKTPNFDQLREMYPFSLLEACGEAVGLVAGGMGGSEIGHFAIGAGRVVPQTRLQIDWSIKDKSFFENPALSRAFRKATKLNEDVPEEDTRRLHLLGMISDAGVHSHVDHLFALLKWVNLSKVKKCFLHCIADGRDVESRSVKRFLHQIHDKIVEYALEDVVVIGTLIGRFYAMDRDNNWDRVQKCYDLLTKGSGDHLAENSMKNLEEKVDEFYASDAPDTTDYFIPPILCDGDSILRQSDCVIFFNYRTDRPRQLTEVFENEKFSEFETRHDLHKLVFLTMGPYSEKDNQEEAKKSFKQNVKAGLKPQKLDSFKYNILVGFPTPAVENNLGSWLGQLGVPQLRIAETEKYAHVTYFFNSQTEEPNKLEDRVLIPSKKCNSFAEIPEMSAREITDAVVDGLKKKAHDLIVVNYANADLVGHTGKLKETIQAIEVLDECMRRVNEACVEAGYVFVLTGDHGNAEDMTYDDGSEKVSHSMNKVICMVGNTSEGKLKLKDGGLADVAPTILELMGLRQPEEMTGESLINH